MLIMFVGEAYSIALFSAMFIPFMTFYMQKIADDNKNKLALLAMVSFGAGEIIGAILFGRI